LVEESHSLTRAISGLAPEAERLNTEAQKSPPGAERDRQNMRETGRCCFRFVAGAQPSYRFALPFFATFLAVLLSFRPADDLVFSG
jgi:hypothetical protein